MRRVRRCLSSTLFNYLALFTSCMSGLLPSCTCVGVASRLCCPLAGSLSCDSAVATFFDAGWWHLFRPLCCSSAFRSRQGHFHLITSQDCWLNRIIGLFRRMCADVCLQLCSTTWACSIQACLLCCSLACFLDLLQSCGTSRLASFFATLFRLRSSMQASLLDLLQTWWDERCFGETAAHVFGLVEISVCVQMQQHPLPTPLFMLFLVHQERMQSLHWKLRRSVLGTSRHWALAVLPVVNPQKLSSRTGSDVYMDMT